MFQIEVGPAYRMMAAAGSVAFAAKVAEASCQTGLGTEAPIESRMNPIRVWSIVMPASKDNARRTHVDATIDTHRRPSISGRVLAKAQHRRNSVANSCRCVDNSLRKRWPVEQAQRISADYRVTVRVCVTIDAPSEPDRV